MRVAFFTEAYEPFINGAVILAKSYRRQLEAMGHEVIVFTPEYPGFRDADDYVVRLPSVVWSKKGYPCLQPFPGIESEFRRWRFDLIHSHHPFTMGLAAERMAERHGIPLVYTFHTLLPAYSSYVPLPGPLARRMLVYIIRRHCAHARCVTVTNSLMRTWLLDHGVQSPVWIVPPVVSAVRAVPGTRESIRARYGIAPDTSLLLYVGRLTQEKNLDLLLRAVARVKANPDWRLMVVGSGSCKAHLASLSSRLRIADRVLFAGEVGHDLVGGYYAAADVFVFPSLSETLGLVLLEAMSAGLPCVAVGVNGPLAVVQDGVTGLLTRPDETAFSKAVESLLTDRDMRRSLGNAARKLLREYSPANVGAKLMEAYSQASLGRA